MHLHILVIYLTICAPTYFSDLADFTYTLTNFSKLTDFMYAPTTLMYKLTLIMHLQTLVQLFNYIGLSLSKLSDDYLSYSSFPKR